MKTNRIIVLFAAAALTLSVSAQQSNGVSGAHDNYVGVNFGGGLNTMLYKPANGQQQVGLGFDVGLFYGHFFNSWAGVGAGVQFSWANAYATYNWKETTPGLTHPSNPNTPYTLIAGFNQFVERQNVGVLSIPVEALFRKAFNDRVALIGGVGVSLDLPLYGTYQAKGGTYSTTGVFPAVGSYEFSSMPEHGFGTYNTTQNAKFKNRATVGASVIGDIGARIALTNNWGLYIGVNVGYGFTNMLGAAKTDEMIMVNATDPSVIDYRGTFDSNETNKVNLLRCGLKIAVDFGWPAANQKAEKERLAREEADRLAAELAAAERAEAERLAQQEAERIAREEADRLAKAKAAAEAQARAQAEAEARAKADSAANAHAARVAHVNALKAKGESVTVHFESGAAELQFKAGEQDIVDEICEAMVEEDGLRIIITGHTDNQGNPEQNLRYFGMKRAEALKAYMVKKGVSADQIKCESKGDLEPAVANDTPANRALNRRACIRFE